MTVIESIVRDLGELPPPKLVDVARYVHGLNPKSHERRRAALLATAGCMTGEKGEVYKRVLSTLARLDLGNLVIRARFVRGDVDNSTVNEVRGWIKTLQQVKPARIEICSPKKAFLAKTKPITATRMKEILAEIEDKVGIPAEIVEE